MTGRDFHNIRGPYKGRTIEQYEEACRLRNEGYGYRTISNKLNIPWGTIRNWTSEIDVDPSLAFEKALEEQRKPLEELTSKNAIRKRLIENRGHICEWCGNSHWLDSPIMLEMHRLNGNDQEYNDINNVVLLCPNCHSTTDDFRNKAPVVE